MSDDDPAARNHAMIEALRAAGRLNAPIAAAMRAVPRHLFAPDAGWFSPDHGTGPGRAVHRRSAPADWWAAVYADGSLITQRDDGAAAADAAAGPRPARCRRRASSASSWSCWRRGPATGCWRSGPGPGGPPPC
ncbi:hypothetical protein ACFQHO_53340 [Actinomadura yumaensis]|uniref:hypothetical protein n=1 Tax=Actinomadura yumaensis TaxID=111807 RepID=UPI0036123CEF